MLVGNCVGIRPPDTRKDRKFFSEKPHVSKYSLMHQTHSRRRTTCSIVDDVGSDELDDEFHDVPSNLLEYEGSRIVQTNYRCSSWKRREWLARVNPAGRSNLRRIVPTTSD